MRTKISVAIDEDVLAEAESRLDGGLWRSRSHLVEYALRTFLEEKR